MGTIPRCKKTIPNSVGTLPINKETHTITKGSIPISKRNVRITKGNIPILKQTIQNYSEEITMSPCVLRNSHLRKYSIRYVGCNQQEI